MPRVPQAYLDARRREILLAAHRCFARSGFREATMQEIADEAGLSVGALYRYFDGKDALIRALADWGRAQKREAMEAVESSAGVEGLGELITRTAGYLSGSDEAQDAVRFDVRIWGEALGHPSLQTLVAGGLEGFRRLVADYVGEEQEAGRIRRDVDAGLVARTLVSLLAGLELQMAFDPGLDRDGYADAARRLVASLGPSGG